MKFKFKLIISVLILIQAAVAQEMLTMQDAISIALEKNIGVKVAQNTAEISDNNAHLGKAGLLPKVDVSAGADYSDIENYNQTGADLASTATTASINLNYTLFNGFGRIYTYKKLKSGGAAGELQARNDIESIVSQVVNSYYSVAEASENYQISKDALKISGERLKRAENRSKFGQANTLDVLSAKVDYNTDSISVVNALLNMDQASRNLNTLLNRDGNVKFNVESNVLFSLDSGVEQLKEQALQKNASFLLQKESLKQAGYDIKIANSAFSPSVSFKTGYGYRQTEDDLNVALNDPQKSLTTGMTMNFNLFNGFQNSIDRQNAKIREKNSSLRLEKSEKELKTSVANTYQAYKNSLYVLRVQQQNLEVAELNFKRTDELYRLGQATTTQYREAQLNLSRAKNNISSAKYDAKLNEIELLRISGGLLEE